ncbi:MAG TPA: hypothetical protein DCP90_07920 [Clostridiales bacterium]|nr:MAG: hypothetical protein A2Y22_06115 [Clostridiales bacterium GWD2_32_59]HAN10526.1 hypothetical protein [Clostridiales bacterium]
MAKDIGNLDLQKENERLSKKIDELELKVAYLEMFADTPENQDRIKAILAENEQLKVRNDGLEEDLQ